MNKIVEIWNERYSGSEYVYGENPNAYLKEQLATLSVGDILFVGEGEGRNAVYAATIGWNVSAYDISSEGKKKALQLANKHNVHIDYHVGELKDLNYEKEQFDVIAFVYTHFSGETRSMIHKALSLYLRPGGTIIMEAFSKNQIKNQIKGDGGGGPKNIDMLYSLEEIRSDFDNFKILELIETEVYLTEGDFHSGIGSVIRFVGQKNGSAIL